MTTTTLNCQYHRYPSENISHAIWLNHRLCVSFYKSKNSKLNVELRWRIKPLAGGVRSPGQPMWIRDGVTARYIRSIVCAAG